MGLCLRGLPHLIPQVPFVVSPSFPFGAADEVSGVNEGEAFSLGRPLGVAQSRSSLRAEVAGYADLDIASAIHLESCIAPL